MEKEFVEIVDDLKNEKKWNKLEELCNENLDSENNKLALRNLVIVYYSKKDLVNEKRIIEQLIKVETKKADLYLRLYEIDDTDIELVYKTIYELISEKKDSKADELYNKLWSRGIRDKEKTIIICKKFKSKGFSKNAIYWYDKLAEYYKEKNDWKSVEELMIHSWNVAAQEEIRKNIIAAERELYPNHPHLDYFLEDLHIFSRTDLVKGLKRFHEIVKFDEGRYVLHNSWGVGKIVEFQPLLDEITIDFDSKKGHSLSIANAQKILQPLENNHWLVQLRINKEKLILMINKRDTEVIKMYLNSFPNPIYGIDLKKNISFDLNISDSWWQNMRKNLKKDDFVDCIAGGKGGKFSIRKKPRSEEEKIIFNLTSTKDITKHFELIHKISPAIKKNMINEEAKNKIKSIVDSNIASINKAKVNLKINYYFLLKDLIKYIPFKSDIDIDFKKISNKEIIFIIENINIQDVKIKFVKFIISSEMFNQELKNKLLMAETFGFRDYMPKEEKEKNIKYILNNPFISQEALVWAIDSIIPEKIKMEEYKLDEVTIMEYFHRIFDKAIEVKNTRNQKIITKIREILRRNNYSILERAVKSASLAQGKVILSRMSNSTLLNNIQKSELRTRFIRIRPGLVKSDETIELEEKIFVSTQSYVNKQNLRDNILNNEIPEIVKEIQRAAAMGDLSENFEYHAARSKHRELTGKVEELNNELSNARVIEIENINTDIINIGTTGVFQNREVKKVITILGPWDSNPDKNIVSYLSPFGKSLMGLAIDDSVEIDGEEFILLNIEIAKTFQDNRNDERRKLLEKEDFKNLIEKGKTSEDDKRKYDDRREI